MDDSDRHFGDPDYGVVVPFLRGARPDWAGRWLREIRSWGFEQLEEDHHYIQWLFPLPIESEVVIAPILREGEVLEIRSTPQLQAEVVCSLHQILAFYGYELVDSSAPVVAHSKNFAGRAALWMTPENHNYRRISRILQSLSLVGLGHYATAFYRVLTTDCGQEQVGTLTLWHWRNSVEHRR